MRLKHEIRSETVIQKSRFISCCAPVRTEEEARTFIAAIRKEYPDSTHVCTAYIIGSRAEIQRSNDNGEPSGTAGIPILEAIRHAGLTDTCAAVVRYFSGIKLGTGGLARAYGGCVQEALTEAPRVEDQSLAVWSVTYPYDLSGVLEGWIRRNCEILDLTYEEQVTCTFAGGQENLPDTIRDLSKGTCEANLLRYETREIDV